MPDLIREYNPQPKPRSRLGECGLVMAAVFGKQGYEFPHEDAAMSGPGIVQQVRNLVRYHFLSPRPPRQGYLRSWGAGEGAGITPTPPILDDNSRPPHPGGKRLALIQRHAARFHLRELLDFPNVNFAALKVSSHVNLLLSKFGHVSFLVDGKFQIASAGRVEPQPLGSSMPYPSRDKAVIGMERNRGEASINDFPYCWVFDDVFHIALRLVGTCIF